MTRKKQRYRIGRDYVFAIHTNDPHPSDAERVAAVHAHARLRKKAKRKMTPLRYHREPRHGSILQWSHVWTANLLRKV